MQYSKVQLLIPGPALDDNTISSMDRRKNSTRRRRSSYDVVMIPVAQQLFSRVRHAPSGTCLGSN